MLRLGIDLAHHLTLNPSLSVSQFLSKFGCSLVSIAPSMGRCGLDVDEVVRSLKESGEKELQGRTVCIGERERERESKDDGLDLCQDEACFG